MDKKEALTYLRKLLDEKIKHFEHVLEVENPRHPSYNDMMRDCSTANFVMAELCDLLKDLYDEEERTNR